MAKTYTRRVPKLNPNGQRIGLYLEPQDAALLADLQSALAAERGGTVTLNETMREAIRYRANSRQRVEITWLKGEATLPTTVPIKVTYDK